MEAIAYASRKDPVKHAEQLIKIARYKPDLYFELGSFYVEQKQPEKAKEAFENGVKLGRDSVIMANGCDWLVNYYFDHGQKDKAFDLANKAAEVYSGNGLETMAKLYEKMGKLKEAEDYFAKIKERYDDSAPLDFFYHRHAQENERYKKADLAYQKKIFPAGSRKLDPSQLKTAPTLGILVTSESDLTQKFGLHHGEIIVSVAGTATDNKAQYTYMMDSNHDDNYEFTVWNGKEYRTVKAVLPKHRWGINIEDYKAH
jgi:tetratricopeptide (TPR) repeat protein